MKSVRLIQEEKKGALLLENRFTTVCHVHESQEGEGALVKEGKGD